VLESTSVADLANGTLPGDVEELAANKENWVSLGRIRGVGTR
jgi:hypothetical protein